FSRYALEALGEAGKAGVLPIKESTLHSVESLKNMFKNAASVCIFSKAVHSGVELADSVQEYSKESVEEEGVMLEEREWHILPVLDKLSSLGSDLLRIAALIMELSPMQ